MQKKPFWLRGDSDEPVIQKAYMRQHNGKLPIEDQIDVITVGISFLRFLEIADALHLSVVVVTDNDGSIDALERKYSNYLWANKKEYIKICYDKTIDSGDFRYKGYPVQLQHIRTEDTQSQWL